MKTIGVIGLGSIGTRHSQNLHSLGCKVLGFDIDKEKWGCDLNQLIEESDAVVIASPTDKHYFHIMDVLCEAKPCFVEKPIADRLPDFRESFQQVAMVGYNLRFHECVKRVKEWMGQDLVGAPQWAYFTSTQRSDKPEYLRDGVILNWSHEIDLALYLLGPAKVAASSTRLTNGFDDLTDILLLHDNGCRTTIHLDYLTYPQERHFTIHGTKSRLKADLVGNFIIETPPGGPKGGGPQMIHIDNSFDKNYISEMEAFIDRIDGKETIGATGEDGLRTLEICLEVRKQAGLI